MQPRSNPATPKEDELREIRALLESRTGMRFDASPEGRLSRRIREHLEAKRLRQPSDLLRLLRGSSAECESLLERLLTREDAFFRYPEMLNTLESLVLPEVQMRKFWDNPRSLRIWSAGCGAGHEPYSIALTVAEALQCSENWAVSIHATDASRQAINHAQRGVYSRGELHKLPQNLLDAHFARIGDHFLVKPRVRNMVTFAAANLAQCTYMGRFDCIFCTDVLSYFSEEKRAGLIARLCEFLEPGGYLFLPGADAPARIPDGLQPVDAGHHAALYQKASGPADRRASSPQQI